MDFDINTPQQLGECNAMFLRFHNLEPLTHTLVKYSLDLDTSDNFCNFNSKAKKGTVFLIGDSHMITMGKSLSDQLVKNNYSFKSLIPSFKYVNIPSEPGDLIIWNGRTHHCGRFKRLKKFKKTANKPKSSNDFSGLLQNFSIEVMPRTAEKIANFSEILCTIFCENPLGLWGPPGSLKLDLTGEAHVK